MYCKKCGSEIKEGNDFCTNCGAQINEKVKKDKEPIKIKLSTFIILIVLVVAIFLIIVLALKIKSKGGNNEQITNFENNSIELKEKTETEFENKFIRADKQSETGVTYTFTLNDVKNALDKVCSERELDKFTDFVYTTSNDYNKVYETYYYTADKNDCIINVQVVNDYVVLLTYQYSNDNLEFSESEGKNIYYNTLTQLFGIDYSSELINILEELPDNKAKYNDDYTVCTKVTLDEYNMNQLYITATSNEFFEYAKQQLPNLYDISEANDNVETFGDTYDDTTHLQEQIYEKYPELEGKDGIVCSNTYRGYTDFWLLDENGKKMYFTNIEGFEALLEYCPSAQAILKKQNNSSRQSSKTNNAQEYVNIPKLVGLTEQQAIDKVKNLNIPYEISYIEKITKTEGIVLEQSYHYDVITNNNGDIAGGYHKSILYPRRNIIYIHK